MFITLYVTILKTRSNNHAHAMYIYTYTCKCTTGSPCVYNRVVCQTSYVYVQVRRANKLETAVQGSLACLAPTMKMFCTQNAHVYVHAVSVVTLRCDCIFNFIIQWSLVHSWSLMQYIYVYVCMHVHIAYGIRT